MIFNLFMSVGDSKPSRCTIELFKDITRRQAVHDLIAKYRSGDADAKRRLPAFAFMLHSGAKSGQSKMQKRRAWSWSISTK